MRRSTTFSTVTRTLRSRSTVTTLPPRTGRVARTRRRLRRCLLVERVSKMPPVEPLALPRRLFETVWSKSEPERDRSTCSPHENRPRSCDDWGAKAAHPPHYELRGHERDGERDACARSPTGDGARRRGGRGDGLGRRRARAQHRHALATLDRGHAARGEGGKPGWGTDRPRSRGRRGHAAANRDGEEDAGPRGHRRCPRRRCGGGNAGGPGGPDSRA